MEMFRTASIRIFLGGLLCLYPLAAKKYTARERKP
jgi:hypothetical protein